MREDKGNHVNKSNILVVSYFFLLHIHHAQACQFQKIEMFPREFPFFFPSVFLYSNLQVLCIHLSFSFLLHGAVSCSVQQQLCWRWDASTWEGTHVCSAVQPLPALSWSSWCCVQQELFVWLSLAVKGKRRVGERNHKAVGSEKFSLHVILCLQGVGLLCRATGRAASALTATLTSGPWEAFKLNQWVVNFELEKNY